MYNSGFIENTLMLIMMHFLSSEETLQSSYMFALRATVTVNVSLTSVCDAQYVF